MTSAMWASESRSRHAQALAWLCIGWNAVLPSPTRPHGTVRCAGPARQPLRTVASALRLNVTPSRRS